MFRNRWIAVQPRVTQDAEAADLQRWEAAQVICDWPAATHALLGVLDRAGLPVGMWRWTQNPIPWPGFPGAYLARSRLAQFWNEPDVEGQYPDWYEQACLTWRQSGGLLIRPANSDESRGGNQGALAYDVLGAHCYAGDFANLALVRAGAAGRRVIVTEYGHAHRQAACLREVAHLDETVVIFCHRWEGNAQAGYDTAGVTLDDLRDQGEARGGASDEERETTGGVPLAPHSSPLVSQPKGAQPVIPGPQSPSVGSPAPAFPRLDQGWTKLCGPYCIEAAQDAAGRHVGAVEIYEQVKGKAYAPPGEPMAFEELIQGVHVAAEMGKCDVLPWRGTGGVYDVDEVPQAVAQGQVVIAGVNMADLIPGQDYGHYFLIRSDQGGQVAVVDSYEREDGGPSTYPWWLVRKAMLDNWTGPSGLDAYAYTLVPR